MNSVIATPKVAVTTHPARDRAAKSFRILCVDDHLLVRHQICALLIRHGWGWQSASGGEAALQRLASCDEPVDLLITDHQMPGMNGLERVRQMHATNFSGKILMHSSRLHDLERAAYHELKVDAMVPKTGNPEPVFHAIESLQMFNQPPP